MTFTGDDSQSKQININNQIKIYVSFTQAANVFFFFPQQAYQNNDDKNM